MTLHFTAFLVITTFNRQVILTSHLPLQTLREENEALKQELEAVNRKTAEQVNCQMFTERDLLCFLHLILSSFVLNGLLP